MIGHTLVLAAQVTALDTAVVAALALLGAGIGAVRALRIGLREHHKWSFVVLDVHTGMFLGGVAGVCLSWFLLTLAGRG
ncbi:MAG: hypothetical protein PVH68_05015 [Armatimonadota bacterium]|jgi:hypothetical protein